jgi:cobalt/nickel transport system permease protein
MHIPDGVLGPQVCLATGGFAAAAVGYSLYRLKEDLADRTIPMTGMMAALVFAGQMVNFPIAFFGVPAASGHLLGGVLAAAVLGPWAGCLAITLVLIVQCLLFADGGILALGANVLNMAVIGAWGGYAVLDVVRWLLGGGFRGTLVGAVAASWLTVVAGATVFCVELAFSPDVAELNLTNIFALMAMFHSIIGVGEAVITGGVLSFVMTHRPDLIAGVRYSTDDQRVDGSESHRTTEVGTSPLGFGRPLAAGLIAAIAVAAFLAPFASEFDDGLETVAQQEFESRTRTKPKVLAFEDYKFPLPFAAEESPLWQKLSVSLAGILGVLCVFATAWLLDRGLKRRLRTTPA